MEQAQFEVKRSDVNTVTVLSLKGFLDAHTAPQFETAVQTLLEESRYKIVVDFTELAYISSAGLGVFMGFIEEIRQNGGDMKLAHMSDRVFKIFDLLGFPNLYQIFPTVDEAVRKFDDKN